MRRNSLFNDHGHGVGGRDRPHQTTKQVSIPQAGSRPDGSGRPRVAAVLLVLAPMLLPLLPGQSAHAANIDVNTFADELTRNDGFCSLREAIMAVDMGTAYDDDCPTGDTINLSAGAYTLSIAGVGFSIPEISELDNSVGDLDITRNVTINGAGADKTIIQACDSSGGPCTGIDRILTVWAPATVSI